MSKFEQKFDDLWNDIEELGYKIEMTDESIHEIVPQCIIKLDNGEYDLDYNKFIEFIPKDELIGILLIQYAIYPSNDCCDFFGDNYTWRCIDWMIVEFEFEKCTGQNEPITSDWGYYVHQELESKFMKLKNNMKL